jgi:NAD(P)-dependent dehydrogenase (short-subunit alcohol dehydrogenase family)
VDQCHAVAPVEVVHGISGLAASCRRKAKEALMTHNFSQLDLAAPSRESIEALRPATAFSLSGKAAIVTGAGGGIGSWLATGLAAAGANVLLTDVSEEALRPVQQLLEGAGSIAVTADLLSPDTPDRLVNSCVEHFGSLDVLVNCAAINRRTPMLDVTEEMFDQIIGVDLRSPYFLAQRAAKQMIGQSRGGSILNIGSINVAIGLEGVSLYGAAKAGLGQLTKVMTVEWSQHGIRANCVSPGFMLTSLSAPVWANDAQRRWMMDRVPLRRPGLPHELVGLCVLLASDAGSFISGQTIYVDGGFLAGSRWTDAADIGQHRRG